MERFQAEHLANIKTAKTAKDKQNLIMRESTLNKFDKCKALQTLWRNHSDLVSYKDMAVVCKEMGFFAQGEIADNMLINMKLPGAERSKILRDALEYRQLFKVDLKGEKWAKILEKFVEGMDAKSGDVQGDLECALTFIRAMDLSNGDNLASLEKTVVKKLMKLYAKQE